MPATSKNRTRTNKYSGSRRPSYALQANAAILYLYNGISPDETRSVGKVLKQVRNNADLVGITNGPQLGCRVRKQLKTLSGEGLIQFDVELETFKLTLQGHQTFRRIRNHIPADLDERRALNAYLGEVKVQLGPFTAHEWSIKLKRAELENSCLKVQLVDRLPALPTAGLASPIPGLPNGTPLRKSNSMGAHAYLTPDSIPRSRAPAHPSPPPTPTPTPRGSFAMDVDDDEPTPSVTDNDEMEVEFLLHPPTTGPSLELQRQLNELITLNAELEAQVATQAGLEKHLADSEKQRTQLQLEHGRAALALTKENTHLKRENSRLIRELITANKRSKARICELQEAIARREAKHRRARKSMAAAMLEMDDED
ncbi:hypothetical protein C8R43DRAFT_1024213 [Mycena crocata]|nr:hypothetical protein C8R43DRAFT_1024213 [Mycena crocata]